MNEKSTITMMDITSGELKEFTGYWSLKEIYQFVKNYEKSKNWKVKLINFGINEPQEEKMD